MLIFISRKGRKGNDDEDKDDDEDDDEDDDNDEDNDLLLTTLRTLVVTKFATTPAQAWNRKGNKSLRSLRSLREKQNKTHPIPPCEGGWAGIRKSVWTGAKQ